ncbi:MAG TPA: TIGR03086 family metal-binding protein [Streptosporangiaceae bacterium]|nr:TIGR03086 family metal-binding protein [Streptosporangiaceae bacterium]
MAALASGLELAESAASYALASTAMVTPPMLSRATPCRAWDLATLLDHVTDSAGVLQEAISAGRTGAVAAPGGSGPVARLRRQLSALLATAAAAGPADHPVAIGDRQLAASVVAITGATELAIHGWDIAVACGRPRPVPPVLAVVLLATAPLLVPAGARHGLFADPVPLRGPACPGDELVAFLGRQPFSGPGPFRGDCDGSAWSA